MWVLQERGKESWFKMGTGIGPMFTASIGEAAGFTTEHAAMQSPAWRFPLTVVDAVEVGAEAAGIAPRRRKRGGDGRS